jgi:DNA-binding transcriptional LysR family regulator
MKIPSHDLEAFYSLCSIGNFTRAAKSLGLSQPAFSQRIKNLESFLEQTLVLREKKGIRLTLAGEKLLHYVKVHQQMEQEFLNNQQSGQIRIGGFSSVMRSLVLPALGPFLKSNLSLGIELVTKELSELEPLLRQGAVDFVITNRASQNDTIKSQFLGFEENVLVAHKDYPSHPVFLDHDPDDVTTSSYFSLTNQKRPKNIRYLDDVYGLLDGVKLGLGRAILPKHLLVNESDLIIQKPRSILKVKVYLLSIDSPYSSVLHREVESLLKNIKLTSR